MKISKFGKYVSLSIIALFVFGICFGKTTPVKAVPAIYYVSATGTCGGMSPCYTEIQGAVDDASTGDEIWVSVGTYTVVHARPRLDTSTTGNVYQIVYVTKTVTIRGGYNSTYTAWDPDVYVTTLYADYNGRGIYIAGSISPTIEGFHIFGGVATDQEGYNYASADHDAGGGVYIYTAAAKLIRNEIYDNSAPYGGGVFLNNSTAELNSNTISANTAGGPGGGGGAGLFIYQGSPTLTGNTISSNSSGYNGGALYLFATSATLIRNTIANNATIFNGGGVDVASCSPAFTGNVFYQNTAEQGGGVYLWYSHSTFTNNAIVENQASDVGSGIWIGGSGTSPVILLHTTITYNYDGDGSGIYVTDAGSTHSTVTLTNAVISLQTIGIYTDTGSVVNVDGILNSANGTNYITLGTINVSNSHTGSPVFSSDGYHILAGSAAIDSGVDAGVTTDIDGQTRIGTPDLGADELVYDIFLPLIFH